MIEWISWLYRPDVFDVNAVFSPYWLLLWTQTSNIAPDASVFAICP